MDLTSYVDTLRNDLAVAADFGGDEARAMAERLFAPLESSVRLVLLDVLAAAAGEISRELAPGSVDVRLRGREPSFVVTAPPAERPFDEPESPAAPASAARPGADGDEGAMTRINLRLPQDLKERVEAAAGEAGISVNAWLVRSAAGALGESNVGRRDRREYSGGSRYTGWVR